MNSSLFLSKIGGIMELKIDSIYGDRQNKYKEIMERLKLINKHYVVIKYKESLKDVFEIEDYDSAYTYVNIYKRPEILPDNMVGKALFKFFEDNYYITQLRIKDNIIENYCYNPTQVTLNQTTLTYMFNSIDDIEVKIIKKYYESEFK
jgi:hypothetical protein